MSSLNFNNFLHRFSFLLANKAKMERFLPYEFPWTDGTGNVILVEDNEFLCDTSLFHLFSCSNFTLDIHGTRALKTVLNERSWQSRLFWEGTGF